MIAVVSHDAGGAEILSSFVKRNQIFDYKLFLDGPAKTIFSRKLGFTQLEDSLEKVLSGCDFLLTGTSWQSELEKMVLLQAKSKEIRSASFLDHWINYQERFLYKGEMVLPDEIWVGDEFAFSIAKKLFPNSILVIKENPYVLDLKDEIKLLEYFPSKKGNRILYVCEPIKEHAKIQYDNERYWGYTEDDALQYFLDHSNIFQPLEEILVRPHPSESADKYNWILQKYPHLTIKLGGKETLIQEISMSDIVIGCESMAMVVGLIANKRVISTIPPGGRKCTLPHSQIEHLQFLISGEQFCIQSRL